jgi:WD40 repeat protein
VSGFLDNAIHLWDAETSDAIGEPFEGHSSFVNSVAFSPDGSRIVSGSLNTICLWNAEISGAASKLGFTEYSKLLLSGLAVNLHSKKLFWVLPWHRAGLCYHRNTVTICREGVSTVLDMS